MEGDIATIWPDNVGRSLWNYDRSIAGPSSDRIFNLTNYRIDGESVIYFLIGLVVIWLYSWNRFNRRSYEPGPFDYRVLRELQPAQMRDTLLLHRAFILYALVLTLIYTVFTFFGGLILKIFGSVNQVGPLGFDSESLQSPQWPLIVAFGLAGVTQLVGPLDSLEKMLRSHVHRSLGIPIRIKEYTRLLIGRQLVAIGEQALPNGSVGMTPQQIAEAFAKISGDRFYKVEDWAREEISQSFGLRQILAKLVLLWRMIDNLRSLSWPHEGVRDEMRSLLVRQIHEASTAARYLSDLLDDHEVIDPVPDTAKAAQQTANAATGSPAQGASNVEQKAKLSADGAAQEGDQPPANPSVTQRTRQEQQLVTAIESMERHLFEIGAIHAVYAQRDTNYKAIDDKCLQATIVSLFENEGHGPSLRQLTCGGIVLFLGYYAAMYLANQPLMAPMPRTTWTVGLSASYETLRTLCIYVFPILFAIYMTAPDPARVANTTSVPGSAMASFLWGGLAGLVLMALLAMLYTWLFARNNDNFVAILLGRFGDDAFVPNLVFFVSFAPISAVIAACVSLTRQLSWEVPYVVATTLVAVISAVLIKVHVLVLWSSAREQCSNGWPECLADDFIDMVAAFVAVMFLLQSHKAGRTIFLRAQVAVIALLVWMPVATPGMAQPDPASNGPFGRVVLGFRTDAEPFSYLNGSGGVPRFQGYLADLCYQIFAGSGYQVVSVAVGVDDRFDRLWPGTDRAALPLVDVLCDPVTIRYDDPERWRNGIFSPIVFASGVTYLRSQFSKSNATIQIGFVENTTAATVAQDLCLNYNGNKNAGSCNQNRNPCRALKIRPFQGPQLPRPISVPVPDEHIRFLKELRRPPPSVGSNTQRAWVCPMKSHHDLIRWFCAADAGVQRLYLGDRELIRARWKDWQNRNGSCPAEDNNPSYTYEPYAILVTKYKPHLVQFVQRRVFQIFSDGDKARALFAANFSEYRMTTPLAYLFLLNGVDERRTVQRSDCVDGCPDPQGGNRQFQDGPPPMEATAP